MPGIKRFIKGVVKKDLGYAKSALDFLAPPASQKPGSIFSELKKTALSAYNAPGGMDLGHLNKVTDYLLPTPKSLVTAAKEIKSGDPTVGGVANLALTGASLIPETRGATRLGGDLVSELAINRFGNPNFPKEIDIAGNALGGLLNRAKRLDTLAHYEKPVTGVRKLFREFTLPKQLSAAEKRILGLKRLNNFGPEDYRRLPKRVRGPLNSLADWKNPVDPDDIAFGNVAESTTRKGLKYVPDLPDVLASHENLAKQIDKVSSDIEHFRNKQSVLKSIGSSDPKDIEFIASREKDLQRGERLLSDLVKMFDDLPGGSKLYLKNIGKVRGWKLPGLKDGGTVLHGPSLVHVGERKPGDKKYATDEYLFAMPGSIVAPRKLGEKPTAANAAKALLEQGQKLGLLDSKATASDLMGGATVTGPTAYKTFARASGSPPALSKAKSGTGVRYAGKRRQKRLSQPRILSRLTKAQEGMAVNPYAEALKAIQAVASASGVDVNAAAGILNKTPVASNQGVQSTIPYAEGGATQSNALQQYLAAAGLTGPDLMLAQLGVFDRMGNIDTRALGITDPAEFRRLVAEGQGTPTLEGRKQLFNESLYGFSQSSPQRRNVPTVAG